jgi:hypothetical protein
MFLVTVDFFSLVIVSKIVLLIKLTESKAALKLIVVGLVCLNFPFLICFNYVMYKY